MAAIIQGISLLSWWLANDLLDQFVIDIDGFDNRIVTGHFWLIGYL